MYISGSVLGPTFHFSSSDLNFGELAFGFKTSKAIRLINTSLIAMSFKLRMSMDEFQPSPEFCLLPEAGLIPPLDSIEIIVEFTPQSIKKYDESLIVDIDAVGTDLYRLPIFAQSLVPDVI
jgi:hydrocephalus-inducing protein